MEASTDSFYKYLLNRSKNLHKKLEKIDQKKKQVKSQSKQLTPEEKQLLESEPQIDTAIQEIDRHLKAYTAFKKPTQKAPAKEPPKQVDQSNEVVFLWVISEFLRHPEIRQNLSDSQQQFLEALSKISDSTAGESGDSFEQIMANVQKHLSDYLSKAEATLPGTEVKYQALNDFLNDFYNQNSEKNRPELPSEKAELEKQIESLQSKILNTELERLATEYDKNSIDYLVTVPDSLLILGFKNILNQAKQIFTDKNIILRTDAAQYAIL